jgi:heme-degrading monooxygenase HmoA
MHAMVATVEIKAGKADEAVAILNDQVVPGVKAMPGFVSGTWARSADGTKGHSLIIFESEEAAKAAAEQARQSTPPEAPVKMLYAEIYEVLAQA